MKVTVTSRGRITIPLHIRKRLNLKVGTVLEFDETSQNLLARRSVDVKRMRSVIGCAKSTAPEISIDAWLDETRGKVE